MTHTLTAVKYFAIKFVYKSKHGGCVTSDHVHKLWQLSTETRMNQTVIFYWVKKVLELATQKRETAKKKYLLPHSSNENTLTERQY